MTPRGDQNIESRGDDPALQDRPRARSRRRLVTGILIAGLALGAGIAVGAATRNGSSASSGQRGSTSGGISPSSARVLGGASGGLQVAAIAANVDPAVVDIDTVLANNAGAAAGTGMVISASGEVLTNHHVIDDASSITVRAVGSGRIYTATVVGYDVPNDVALLQMKGASALTTITTAKSPSVLIGNPVVAIGNAQGKGGTPTVTQGVISGVDQTVTASDNGQNPETLSGMIQTYAQIQPGDSGGPLVNAARAGDRRGYRSLGQQWWAPASISDRGLCHPDRRSIVDRTPDPGRPRDRYDPSRFSSPARNRGP